MLLPDDDAFRATLRASAEELRLSAAGGEILEGTWKYFDDGELRLEFEGNAVYTPAECEDGELQLKGHPVRRPPPPALDAAILWAWFLDEWDAVPYLP